MQEQAYRGQEHDYFKSGRYLVSTYIPGTRFYFAFGSLPTR